MVFSLPLKKYHHGNAKCFVPSLNSYRGAWSAKCENISVCFIKVQVIGEILKEEIVSRQKCLDSAMFRVLIILLL